MASDDELARTATAAASPNAKRGVDVDVAATLGRFKLARELGSGGMGKVYEAHDPDLDRGVALKVLHEATSEDARSRLLKEARAMAKLSHPNVITVFDVATHDGRDYIAMELIDGAALADWLRDKPTQPEVIAAFVAAARGLAAAHAAGIVHRDFKPHNVLRRSDGRIVVSDFGLAHGSGGHPVIGGGALDRTIGRTATGAVMGTPAYMAPEQWRGETVTAATDQFAFCVALWEALAGEHPFKGNDIDALRAAVLAGPDALDDGKLPRNLRATVRRGLALDPALRWPSMDALIRRLEPRRGRWRIVAAIGGAAVAAAAVAVLISGSRSSGGAADRCGDSAFDPEAVTKRATQRGSKVALAQLADWRERRKQVCRGPAGARAARLACLDGVLARLDDALGGTGPVDPDALSVELVEPAVCDRTPVPHLVTPISDTLGPAYAALRTAAGGGRDPGVTKIARDAGEPCTRAVALVAVLRDNDYDAFDPTTAGALMANQAALRSAADSCSDDAIKALAAGALVQASDAESVQRAEAALAALGTDVALAVLDEAHGAVASASRRTDEALALYEKARARHHAAGRRRAELDVVLEVARTRLQRGHADDLTAVIALSPQWAPAASAFDKLSADRLITMAAKARWRSGDVAGGDAMALTDDPMLHAMAAQIRSVLPAITVEGDVVDDHGQPAGGAEVAAGPLLFSDSVRLASPVVGGIAVSTRTDERGHFKLAEVRGFITAARGELRATAREATPQLHLALAPTSRVHGTVTLGTREPGRLWVFVRGEQKGAILAAIVAPVRADGTFEVAGVPRGKVGFAVLPIENFDIGAAPWKSVVIDQPVIDGIALDDSGVHDLVVVARSAELTAPEMAMVFLFRGRHAVKTIKVTTAAHEIGMWVALARAGPAAFARPEHRVDTRPDDLIAYFASRPPGELTVCTTGLSKKLLASATTVAEMSALMQDAELGCTAIGASDTRVTIEVPPLRRRP